ncbi:hypothetical protein HDU98_008600 [Podochytrium sp. JEL0797]|nr:hypothetical protein HDU98_008600 [Podochytrium sp. JEL0797]
MPEINSLVRVSAIGCLLSSFYVALIALAQQTPLGSPDAFVLVTRSSVALLLWVDVLSVSLSFAKPGPGLASHLVLAAASVLVFALFAQGGEAIAGSRALVLLAVCATNAAAKPAKKLLVSFLPSLLLLLLSIGSLIRYSDSLAFPLPGVLIPITEDSYSLHMYCRGSQKLFVPTIILETGLTVTAEVAWTDPVLSGLEALGGRVCWYDRAGYGYSQSGAMPQTAKRSAEDLHELLKTAQEQGPFVLVGHSYGGHIIRLFSDAHPEQIAGLVFIDASHEDELTLLQKLNPDSKSSHEITQLAWQTALTSAFLSPFAVSDRLLVPLIEQEQNHTYSAKQIAVTFTGKFFKAVSNELFNFETTSASQVRLSLPRRPRTNLPVAVLSDANAISPYCTLTNASTAMTFSNLGDTESDTICIPHAHPSVDMSAVFEAQARFVSQWRLATELSAVTRISFSHSGHYMFFSEEGAGKIVEAVEAVVDEAGRYMRGEWEERRSAAERMRKQGEEEVEEIGFGLDEDSDE